VTDPLERRSLLLAGGGIKAGYQAGCLQVLMDEVGPAKLPFHHIDAASGGCFNAAMICSGRSGTDIASAWRSMNPWDLVSFNGPELRKGLWARSIATLEGVRTKAFTDWGIDFDRIRAYDRCDVTFNYFNFTRKKLEVVLQSNLDEDDLAACVALMLWFPPVEKNGELLVDAVFSSDSNVAQAEARGAREIWAIWTVAREPTYRDGLVAQYFHMLEQSANTNFFQNWERVGRAGIRRELLRQEVPIHYLFNFSQDRMAAVVELGISDMRDFCRDRGLFPRTYAVPAPPPPGTPVRPHAAGVRFSERLTGCCFVRGAAGFRNEPLELRLTLETGDLDSFIRRRDHRALVKTGTATAPAFGGRRAVATGEASILVDVRDPDGVIVPGNKRLIYRLKLRGANGTPYLIVGTKYAIDYPGKRAWRDTTTLYVKIYELDDARPGVARLHGAGIVRLTPRELLRELASFRASRTRNPLLMLSLLRRYLQFFIRQCWDVYARAVLAYAPF
jgi:predicted acylesterase/phospholipase RssA